MSALDPTPPTGYIQLELLMDVDALTLTGIEHMEDTFEGWERNPGNPDTVMIEGAGQIAGELYDQASQMAPEALVRIGTSIYDIPMLEGTQATATATFVFDDTAQPGMIDEGSWVSVPHPSGQSILFATADDLIIVPSSALNMQLIAEADGSAANGAFGEAALEDPIEGLTQIIVSEAAGGTDSETALEYLSRLSSLLTVLSPKPILPEDHAVIAANNVPGVGRAAAINLLVPGKVQTPDAIRDPNEVGYFTPLGGVPNNDTFNVPRCTTVAIAPADPNLDAAGLQALKQQVWAYLDSQREVNFLNYVIGPTYSIIEVKGEVHQYPGYTQQDAIDGATYMIENWLNPTTYGTGPGTTTGKEWANDTTLRHDEAVDFANRGAAVWWTRNIQMRIKGGAWTAADILLPGLAPLPKTEVGGITFVGV